MPTYKAIQTQVVFVTETLSIRIKVWAERCTPIFVSKASLAGTDDEVHALAAEEFRRRYQWREGQWVQGVLSSTHRVHVRAV